MAEVGGYGGDVTLGGGLAGEYVTAVKSWTMNYEVQAHDSTDFASVGEGDVVRGVRKWSGSYTCSLDSAVAITSTLPGTAGTAIFTASAGRTFSGSIMITAVSFGAGVGALNEATISYESKTALNIA